MPQEASFRFWPAQGWKAGARVAANRDSGGADASEWREHPICQSGTAYAAVCTQATPYCSMVGSKAAEASTACDSDIEFLPPDCVLCARKEVCSQCCI